MNDCLVKAENEKIITALETTKNRGFTRLGFNYIELKTALAKRLLKFLSECPSLVRVDILGNDFSETVQ